LPDLICDTSVLIVLHQVSQLSILSALGSSVIVSTAVVKELAAGRLAGSDAVDVALYPWMMVRAPTACPKLPSQATFGPGESSVIWLALELPGSIAILDDGPARRVASQLGISYTGTVGLILDAKQRGLIAAAKPVLDDLAHHEFNLSPRIRESILKASGETP